MGMCLRPCQQVVGPDEYAHEVSRVVEFLSTDGKSLLDPVASSRDRLSEEMRFEEAARQHKRFEKIQEVLKARDDLARDLDKLNGVAITASAETGAIELWIVANGWWQDSRRFRFEMPDGQPVSLDRRLRDLFEKLELRRSDHRERQEYLALLARWYYSSWRDGEWLDFEDFGHLPYRRLVNAISRVARQETTEPEP